MAAPLIKPKKPMVIPRADQTMTGSVPEVTQVTQTGLRVFHNQSEDLDQYESASFGQRAFALFIDSFLLGSIMRLMDFLLRGLSIYLAARWPLARVILTLGVETVLSIYIFAWPLTEWGCTAGKKLMGLRVVNTESHHDISFSQALNREIFGKGLSGVLFGIGYLQVLTRADRLALHDRLSHTRVIRYRKND